MSMLNMLMGALKEKEEFTQTFNYTGSAQTFSIPAGLDELEAYVFGPGGGPDTSDGITNSTGGAGGFTTGTIDVSSGGTLKIIVGGGGGPGTQSNGSSGGPGGGAVRIIWPGDDRQFPLTRTADE